MNHKSSTEVISERYRALAAELGDSITKRNNLSHKIETIEQQIKSLTEFAPLMISYEQEIMKPAPNSNPPSETI